MIIFGCMVTSEQTRFDCSLRKVAKPILTVSQFLWWQFQTQVEQVKDVPVLSDAQHRLR